MRFLMLNWRDPFNPASGGAERVSRAFMAELVRRGHEVTWFANAYPSAPAVSEIDGIQIIRGGGKGTSILAARRWYREQSLFNLVIDQHHGIPWYAPWWSGTRCIAYIHEVLGPIWTSFYPWPLSLLGQLQERFTHWLYRKVPFWTVCESTRRELERSGVREIKVFSNGIDPITIPVLPEKSLQTPIRFAAVSRLAPNKRIDHIIRALGLLRDAGIEAELAIVGTGEKEKALNELASGLGLQARVTFHGPLPESEKNAVLQRSHFLLHTSQREGWGLNVIEANAMGTPAMVYPVAGLVDSTIDGVTGLVAKEETPASLAACAQSLLARPEAYNLLRIKAWERARTLHWENVLAPACDWLETMAR